MPWPALLSVLCKANCQTGNVLPCGILKVSFNFQNKNVLKEGKMTQDQIKP